MPTRRPTEKLQNDFCDALEDMDDVLARRYDTAHRERLTMAGRAVHWWLTSLDSAHEGAAATMTLAEFANAYAEASGGLRKFEAPHCRVGQECADHGYRHGQEAEELRVAFEKMRDDFATLAVDLTDLTVSEYETALGQVASRIQTTLDDIDARDSLAFVEARAAAEKERT